MADKRDGITDLTKLLVTASKKFTKTEYSNLTSVVFAMLHGVNYGYNEMDQRFLNDARDIFEFNQVDNSNKVSTYHNQKVDASKISNFKKKRKSKNNVIKFSDYAGATHDGR